MRQTVASKHMRNLARGVVVVLILLLLFPSQAFARRAWRTYVVTVDSGYLALRSRPGYDESNEIGELYPGDVVSVINTKADPVYWKVMSPKYQKLGWVNKNYLTYIDNRAQGTYTVSVAKGYLALRTYPSYDPDNEIGELYTGDTVVLLDRYNNQYWWVYSPKHYAYGYVNKDYLYYSSSSTYSEYSDDYMVRVQKGYLALRTAPAYDDANEIGRLYTGDFVSVQDRSNGTYWWVYSPRYGRSGYVNKNYLVKR